MRAFSLLNSFVGLLVMLSLNWMANGIPLGGHTTGELSAMYPNLFVPAGITFSIWGVLYLLMIVYTLRLLPKHNAPSMQYIMLLYPVTCYLNAGWILAWHYQMVLLSVIIMIALLGSLVLLNLQLKFYYDTLGKITFGMYLGWICVATIANVTALLVSWGWTDSGMLAQVLVLSLIIIAVGIVLFSVRKLENPWLMVSVVWAFIGMMIRHVHEHTALFWGAALGIMLLLAAWWWMKNNLLPESSERPTTIVE